MAAVLEVLGLWKRYRVRDPWGVEGISFKLQEGQAFGLLGPNGAGKSTVVKAIVGLTRPDAGMISVFGSSPGDVAARAAVGFAPEEPDFAKYLRADEVLDYFGRLLVLPAGERRQVRHFSKGMKQRLGLAQAILGRPKLLMLDEPTAYLDPIGRRDMRELIAGLKARGTTVLLNSHLLSEVERVCDRVAIMARGRILEEGPMHELVPEGRTLEEVFMALLDANAQSREAGLPAFMAENQTHRAQS